jgi:hypothetical protein
MLRRAFSYAAAWLSGRSLPSTSKCSCAIRAGPSWSTRRAPSQTTGASEVTLCCLSRVSSSPN